MREPTLQITRSRIPILQARVDNGTATEEETAMLDRMRRGHATTLEQIGN